MPLGPGKSVDYIEVSVRNRFEYFNIYFNSTHSISTSLTLWSPIGTYLYLLTKIRFLSQPGIEILGTLGRDLELQSNNKCDSDDSDDASDNNNPLDDSVS